MKSAIVHLVIPGGDNRCRLCGWEWTTSRAAWVMVRLSVQAYLNALTSAESCNPDISSVLEVMSA